MNRLLLFYIGAGIIVFVYLGIVAFSFSPFNKPSVSLPSVSSITPAPNNTQRNTNDAAQTTQEPRETSASKLLDKIENRKFLSEQDAIKRAVLVARLQGESGILTTTDDYVISYLKTPDVFQVEIKGNVEAARQKSKNWFKEQSLSESAICALPISYFPSYALLQELKSQKKTFSALPDGC